MISIESKITSRTTEFRLADFYPVAGLVSIALYFVFECLAAIL